MNQRVVCEEVQPDLPALVRLAQTGDGYAKERLIQQFTPMFQRIAKRYQYVSPDDALQEAYAAFLDGVSKYDFAMSVPFPGYIRRKVYGDVRTAMRREMTYRGRTAWTRATEEDEGSELEPWDGVVDLVDSRAAYEAADTRVWLAAVGLTPREQLGVYAVMQGLPSSVLAAATGVNAESVKTWRKRALKKLRSAGVCASVKKSAETVRPAR